MGDRSYGGHVLREHVSQEYMSYRMGGHVLQENMYFWEYVFYRGTCLMGEHILWEDMSYWRHVLMEDTSYWRTCLTGGMS